jgi:hypothetical protein
MLEIYCSIVSKYVHDFFCGLWTQITLIYFTCMPYTLKLANYLIQLLLSEVKRNLHCLNK